ncbi:T9SS type A sorting domain-containing protein [Polaribacter sp. PL03]|uniref:T9SS type A sorting domain-containing protein n=1 Tax=Polaribacter sp. PL03 TaxID=3088353 RepID=UPI0029D3F924|nr:T9SS type A sorting domain-containing protein [Polaribacter sp. PL03]MDX6746937.1 T9SS type A sorting domain-containing protein [Polaribacter sp. PL03]
MKKRILKRLLLAIVLTISSLFYAQTPRDFNFDTDEEGFLLPGGSSFVVEGGFLKVTPSGASSNTQIRKNAVDVGSAGELSRVIITLKNATNATTMQLKKSGTLIVGNITISANDTSVKQYVIDVPSGNTDWVGSLQLRLQFVEDGTNFISGVIEVDRIQVGDSSILSVEKNTLEGVHIYPNPVSKKLQVNTLEGGEISLYTILGSKIISTTTKSVNYTVDTSNIKSGIYLLKIISKGKSFTQKLIVE